MKKPKLEELTLREKIGQTCVGLIHFSKGNPEWFKQNPYGSLCGFRWQTNKPEVIENFKNYGYDIADIQNYSKNYSNWVKDVNNVLKVPAMSPFDAENGMAAQMPGCTQTASASCIGSADSEELAYEIGKNIAMEAKVSGCNWIWGPYADNPGMLCGLAVLRNFSYDIDNISKMTVAQIKGMQSVGVAATAKHFPGSDKTEYRDSHIQNSVISSSLEEWEKHQAPSFKAAIDAGVYSIMVGHSAFPAMDSTTIDGEYVPSTLSYKIITEQLKGKMGFDGVVITDGIGMRCLTSFYTGRKLYVELLKAGNDVILGPEQDGYIDEVEKAVLEGELPESRVDDACMRVLNMKEKLGMFEDDFTMYGGVTEELLKATEKTNREITRRGITLVIDKTNQIPLNPEKVKKVAILYHGCADFAYDNLKYMVAEFEKHGAKADLRRSITTPQDMHEVSQNYDLIVYASYIGPHNPMGMPAFSGDDCKTFWWVLTEGKEKSIGVSLGYPFMYYNYYQTCPTYINTFGSSKENVEECVKGMYGEFEISTTSPFPIKPEF